MAPSEMLDAGRPRIVVIEADRILRKLLVRLLDSAGFDSLTLEGWADLAAIQASGALALVVDDDGFGDARATLPALPTVLLTSALEAEAAPGRPLQIVTKPLLIEEFLGALTELVQTSSRDAALGGIL